MPALEQHAATAPGGRLLIVDGEEGAGKSTIVRALLPHTWDMARDAGPRLDSIANGDRGGESRWTG